MGVLSNLEPKNVFGFFEEICKIPHGSGNVGQISDYLVDFAKQRKLYYEQDEAKNVIIVKEATAGYEDQPPIILQGHMDMVAVKKPDCDIDMKTEGLRLAVDGDKVYAEGTSLGGDDGIAVAYSLALLDADYISHPRLEVVITVDEEVGLDGARVIDLSRLKANRMLNLDSEEEGIFLTSCAGGARVDCVLPVQRTLMQGVAVGVNVEGLQGGHSGAEIHKERGNSNSLMGRILYAVIRQLNVGICELQGGLADNAIPRQTKAVLVVEEKDRELLEAIIHAESTDIAGELARKDPDFKVKVNDVTEYMQFENDRKSCTIEEQMDGCDRSKLFRCVAGKEAARCAAFLTALPNGVQAMSADIPGLVETSLNLGLLSLKEDGVHAGFAVRSSVESAKYALIGKLQALTALAGGSNKVTGDYPGWQYRVDSPLRDKMVKLYREMYGQEPKVEAIHAGLECGILGSKIPNLDCVSLGPDMKDIHTTEETLSISSTERVWKYLVRLLEEKDV